MPNLQVIYLPVNEEILVCGDEVEEQERSIPHGRRLTREEALRAIKNNRGWGEPEPSEKEVLRKYNEAEKKGIVFLAM